jgi:FKBP-type peptidyl-prolyl cis-trans isomerase (trigger factor)
MSKPKQTNSNSDTNTEKSMIGANVTLELTIDKETAAQAYHKALSKLAQKVKTSGFRQGKVPAKIAEEILGTEKITQEALQKVVPPIYQEAVKKEKKSPLTQPEFKVITAQKGEEWKVEASIAEYPEIILKGYEKIVRQAIKDAASHDAQHHDASSQEDQSGKEKQPQQEPTEEQRREHILNHIYQGLITQIKPTIPELLVKEEVRSDLENIHRRLQQANLTFDDLLKQRQMTFEQLSSELATQALGRLQLTFILDSLAKELKLTVEDQEIEAAIAKTEDKKLQKQQKSDQYYQNWLRQTLLRKKLTDHLLSL